MDEYSQPVYLQLELNESEEFSRPSVLEVLMIS